MINYWQGFILIILIFSNLVSPKSIESTNLNKSSNVFKNNSSLPNDNYVNQLKDSLEYQKRQILILKAQLQNSIDSDTNKSSASADNRDEVLDIAGKIIDWSSMFFGMFVIILAIAGWIAAKRFSQIEELRKELEGLIVKNKKRLEKYQVELDNIKTSFEEEKNTSLNLLFPVIEGRLHFYQGNYEKAIGKFRQAAKIRPDHPQIYDLLNTILMENGQINEAINNLENLRQKFPDNFDILYKLSEAYRRKNEFEKSKVLFNECLKLKSNDSQVFYNLGVISLFENDYIKAEQYFIEANKYSIINQGLLKYWIVTNLALAQNRLDKDAESIKNFKLAKQIIDENLSRRPNHPQLHGYKSLVLLCIDQKESDESLALMKQAIELGLQVELAKSILRRIKIFFSDEKENNIVNTKQLLEDRILQYQAQKNNQYFLLLE